MKLKLTTTTFEGKEVKAIQLPKSHNFWKEWNEKIEPTQQALKDAILETQTAKEKENFDDFKKGVEKCETLYRNGKLIARKLWSALEYDIHQTFPNDYDENTQTLRVEGELILILDEEERHKNLHGRLDEFAKEYGLNDEQRAKLERALTPQKKQPLVRRVSIKGDDYEGLSLGQVIQKLQDDHNIPDEIAVEIGTEVLKELKGEGNRTNEGDTNEPKLRFDEKKGFYTLGD